MADFRPLVGKAGKPSGLASPDNLSISTGSALKVTDAAGFEVNGVAINAAGFAAKIGFNASGLVNTDADDLQEAIADLDAAVSGASTLAEIFAASDASNDLVMDIGLVGTDTTLKLRGEFAVTGTTAENYFQIEDDAGAVPLWKFEHSTTANEVKMTQRALSMTSDASNATIASAGVMNLSATSIDAGSSPADFGSSSSLDVPAGTAFKIGGSALTTASFTAANVDDLLDTTDISSATGSSDLHSHDTRYVRKGVSSTMGSNIDITFAGGGEVLGLPSTPSAADAAASKAYVDAVASGLDVKNSVRLLSDADIASLSGSATIDSVSTVVGDRVLLTAQSPASENGIWVVAAGAWTRPADFAAASSAAGAFTFIEAGTNYADTGWVCSSNVGADVVDTNNLAFTQFSSAGVVTASLGLEKVVNDIRIAAAAAGAGLDLTTGVLSVKAGDGIELAGAGSDFVTVNLNGTSDGTSGLQLGASGLALSANIAGDGVTLTNGVLDVDLAAISGLSFATGELQLDDSVAGAGIEIASKVLAIDLAATSGLNLSGGELAIDDSIAGAGIEISSKVLAIDLAATSGLNLTGGELALDDSVAGDGLDISSKVLSVDQNEIWKTLTNATGTTTCSALDVIVMNDSGTMVKGDCDDAFSRKIVGVAKAAAAATASVDVYNIPGQTIPGFTGLTAGSVYYISATAGGLTATAPSTAGQQVVQAGFAISTTELVYMPQFMYEVA